MKKCHTKRDSPYRCQSKINYLLLELLVALGGGGRGGRTYVVEARLPYTGKLNFKCKSRVGFRLDESQVYNKSPELQERLLHSYMELKSSTNFPISGLRLEKALLPTLCSIKGTYPEVVVTAGKSLSIRVTKVTRWEVPEDFVDELYAILTKEVHRLSLALSQIEVSMANSS